MKWARKMLKVYNTLTRKKEEFIPLIGNRVGMYVCGLTPDDYTHLGHARCYVAFDVIRRYLEYRGYNVLYVQNFTDVNDRIFKKAAKHGEDPLERAKRFIEEYFKDIDLLGVKRANIYPKVTEHIPEIIGMIKTLVDKGYAYESNGSVYFDVSRVENFGQLSHQSIDDMRAGAGAEIDEDKHDPMDFALWKKRKEEESVYWESPWGEGRPGWHIECSAMSTKYIGETLDIHGGGIDLIFPHHESEILQSESATGKQFVRYWLHNGHVMINREKMSKSLGNFFTIKEILERYEPKAVRFLLINTHYKSPIDFSDQLLDEAKTGLARIENTIDNVRFQLKKGITGEGTGSDEALLEQIEETRKKFENYMDDDFNTREAIAIIFEFTRIVNNTMANNKLKNDTLMKVLNLYTDFGNILGLFQEKGAEGVAEEELVQLIMEIRERARKSKDFQTADWIRTRLIEMGFVVEDSTDGVRVKRK